MAVMTNYVTVATMLVSTLTVLYGYAQEKLPVVLIGWFTLMFCARQLNFQLEHKRPNHPKERRSGF